MTQHHFLQGDSILIVVPNQEAAVFIDQLLWKRPEESFLPHVIASSPIKERVVITTRKENLNKARVLFNLCPEACPFANEFEEVYELHDETQADKLELSQKRRDTYVAAGYEIRDRKEI